jgi:hypothetical protein
MISRGDFRMMIDNSNRVQAVGTTLLCIIERSLPRRQDVFTGFDRGSYAGMLAAAGRGRSRPRGSPTLR